MTFRDILLLYSGLKRDVQNPICAEFGGVFTSEELEELIKMLVAFRNVCSHDQPLFYFVARDGKKGLNEWVKNADGNFDFYSLIKGMSLFLNHNERNELGWGLHDLLRKVKDYKTGIHPIAYDNLVRYMGLAEDWENQIHIKHERLKFFDDIKIDTENGSIALKDLD